MPGLHYKTIQFMEYSLKGLILYKINLQICFKCLKNNDCQKTNKATQIFK